MEKEEIESFGIEDNKQHQSQDEVKMKPLVRLQLSEVEIKVQDSIGFIAASPDHDQSSSLNQSSTRPTSAGYRRRILQSVFSYLNPLGYFRTQQGAQTEQDIWEIPFEDIQELSFIGSGGQGTVFSGLYRDREIAIKKVNDPKQTDIKHLRKLVHPNIIKFLGVCTKPPCYCVIMDYCKLGNLYSYIRKINIEILPEQVMRWARDISNGMQFLHSKRIIHRDLKSLNILVNEDEVLKISDFGTSRFIENQTAKMTVIGSSSWMAPELIRNESYNEKVDVWSFGVCLWELLTREEPYKDLNYSAILYGVGTNKLSLPIPNGCPHDMKALLESCWNQKAKSRPSFRQILDQLNVILFGEFLEYTPSEYKSTQNTWKLEICSIMKSLAQSLHMYVPSDAEESAHIVSKREEELRHAKEVRDMYEKKLATATELCEQLAVCKDILSQKEQKLEKLAKKLCKEEWLQQKSLSTNSNQSQSSGEKVKKRRIRSSRKRNESLEQPTTPCRSFSHSTSKTLSHSTSKSLSTASSVLEDTCSIHTVSSSASLALPQQLITSHGDYSPAVKDFLDDISSTNIRAPFTRRHIRAHSYSGTPILVSKEQRHSARDRSKSTVENTQQLDNKYLVIINDEQSSTRRGKLYKDKSFDDDDESTEIPTSSNNSDNSPSDLSSPSDDEK